MTQNFFAACRHNGSLVARRIRLDSTVQVSITDLFALQEENFRNGVDTEVNFNGEWNPEDNEIFTIDVPIEAEIFEDAVNANATSIQDIDISNFVEEDIRAIFTGFNNNGVTIVLVQRFTSMQFLQKKWALLYSKNAFRRLSEPSFSLDTTLTCIIENAKIKFKSHHKLRSIINMQDIYKEATDQEVSSFCHHNSIKVDNVDVFLNDVADQTIRKLIGAILTSRILDKYSVCDINNAANKVGVIIDIDNNKIIMPDKRADVKNLLRFLDDSLYEAALTHTRYVTNSKKIV